MIELQVASYVVGLLLVWAGAPWEAAMAAWGVGFVMVWRGCRPFRAREKPAETTQG